MKYFSMFSGIGGFELGIKEAYETNKRVVNSGRPTNSVPTRQEALNSSGVGDSQIQRTSDGSFQPSPICVGYSEIDKYAIQIYEKNFGGHKNYGDATKINAEELPDFDLLVGGFPCQAFSVAGKRRGFDDTRGTLFFDIARILRAKQPRLFVLENVKGLLSHDNGHTFRTIISTLAELGYDLEWQVLNSKNHGVPQNRERVFIIGYLGGGSGRKVFPFRGNDKTLGYHNLSYVGAIDSIKRWKDSGKQYSREFSEGQRVYSANSGIGKNLNSNGGGLGAKTGLYVVRQPLKFLQRNQKNIEGDYSCTVDSSNTGGLRVGDRIRRLTPMECERLQGFPDGWTEGISDSQRYKCLGNAVTVNVVSDIFATLDRSKE